jgi:hypothetical protein
MAVTAPLVATHRLPDRRAPWAAPTASSRPAAPLAICPGHNRRRFCPYRQRARPWSSAAVRREFRRSPPRPVSGAASRRTSCGTPTPWSSSETVPGLGARRRRPASASSETDAARAGMREFAARANVYRSRLGDESALTAARLLAAEIDNPALANDARRATCVPSRALRRRRVRRALSLPRRTTRFGRDCRPQGQPRTRPSLGRVGASEFRCSCSPVPPIAGGDPRPLRANVASRRVEA